MPTQPTNKCSRIKKLPVFHDQKELGKFLETNFTESLKQFIKVTIQSMVKEEMENIRAQVKESEALLLSFNGYYQRNMLSRFGKIGGIPIPRYREGFGEFRPQSLQVFDVEREKFMRLIEQLHLHGITQRKLKKVAQECFGITISPTRIGKVYQEYVHREEVNINRQILSDEFEYLIIDGIYETTKGYGWENNQSVLLCVLGVKGDGTRKIIGFLLVREESIATWSNLLGQIKERGLKGKNLKLIITDDSSAIKGAVEKIYAGIPLQLCIAHKMRNVISKTSRRHKTALAEDLKIIFKAARKKEAEDIAKAVCKKWYIREPKAIESLRYNLEYCFTYFDFPKEKWKQLRTTNLLEREFREVRRRIRIFDSTFQHEPSGMGYMNSLFNYLNDHYPAHLHTGS